MKISNTIYLDNHSTTPLDPRVLRVMTQAAREVFGNAASTDHSAGKKAAELVEQSRVRVADLTGAKSEEIIFTGGATESNNLALKGIFEIYGEKKSHLITQVTEHKSVLGPLRYLEKKSARVSYLPVNANAQVDLKDLEKNFSDKTLLVSIMAANHEAGTIHPLKEIGERTKSRGVFFHVDASQAAGKIPLDVEAMGIDLLSLSAHKMYGPKGVGALYIRKENPRVRVAPLFHGGGHEQGLRSGTLNVPAIVGFGEACRIAKQEMKSDTARIQKLRNELFQIFQKELPDIFLNGSLENRLAGNLNLSFERASSADLLREFSDRLAVSTGSACATQSPEPSYVLQAMGISAARIHSSLRFGLGRFTTQQEIRQAAKIVIAAVRKVRKSSPF